MRHSLLAVGIPVLALGAAALGQSNVERFERRLEQIELDTRTRVNAQIPAGQRTFFDYGGYTTANLFSIEDTNNQTHVLTQYDLAVWARLNIDNVHEFFVRGRTSYQHFIFGQSLSDDNNELDTTLDQASYRFDLANYLSGYKGKQVDYNVVLQGGRQFVVWGNGLVFADTLDGGSIDLKLGKTDLLLLGGVTTNEVIDFDSSRPDFDDHTTRVFYGGMLTTQIGKQRPFAYVLVQRDDNPDDPLVVNAVNPPIVTNFEYNSWYIGLGANGSLTDRLLYGVEFAYEGGHGLSSSVDSSGAAIPQEEKDISAAALDVKLDYLLADQHNTRFTAEAIFATGDDDRQSSTNTFGGNVSGKDTAFNAWGLLNTGLAFAPQVSNICVYRVGASAFPFSGSNAFRKCQVGADVLFFTKFDMDAPIDEPTTDDRFLGFEPDLFVNWQISSDITLALRYGLFVPGSAIVNNDAPRNFFYMGVTFAF
jgi:hypothetical protein